MEGMIRICINQRKLKKCMRGRTLMTGYKDTWVGIAKVSTDICEEGEKRKDW